MSPSLPKKGFRIDRNGDGVVSKREYDAYLDQLGVETEDQHTKYDADGNGELHFDEVRGQFDGSGGSYQGVSGGGGASGGVGDYGDRNPFSFDSDGDGEIQKGELDQLLTDLDFTFTEDEKTHYMEAYDKDGDGGITESELRTGLTTKTGQEMLKKITYRCATPKPTILN